MVAKKTNNIVRMYVCICNKTNAEWYTYVSGSVRYVREAASRSDHSALNGTTHCLAHTGALS